MGYVPGQIQNRGLCYTGMLKIQQNLRVDSHLLGCICPVSGILIFSGVTGAVPDLKPANEMLSQCTMFSIKVSAITKKKQFYNICRVQKDLGKGRVGVFKRNFQHLLMYFFLGLNLSVGSAAGSVISQSLQQWPLKLPGFRRTEYF